MSERKVLQKYYPPDFDPRELTRKRGPKNAGPKSQTVRLMAPFSMKCTTCGEYIYRGRKFNARKESPLEERYLGIQIYFFSIKCTRCSAEIIFRTDPKNNDYAMVKGALRNMEPWRNKAEQEESVEQRLDRLEKEEAEAAGEEVEDRNAMTDLEASNLSAQREMAAADALDEIRRRNARIQIAGKEDVDFASLVVRSEDEERERQEQEDEEAAKAAFAAARVRGYEWEIVEEEEDIVSPPEPKVDEWAFKKLPQKGSSASRTTINGLKTRRKSPEPPKTMGPPPKPQKAVLALVADYDSD
jgi:hypothetical protein